MDSTQIYVDDSNFVAFVDGMKSKRVRNIEKQSLRKTANLMRKEAVASLRRAKGKVLAKSKFKNDWYKGIRSSVQETKQGELFWQVHILGWYMLKWYETGTNYRVTKKKGWRRGEIKPLWFFKQAAQANKDRLIKKQQDEFRNIIVKEFIQNNGI